MDGDDPRARLARRLRDLREKQPGHRITQDHLARALGVSVALISGYETKTIPPPSRIEAYAALFAIRRSLTGIERSPLHPISWDDMTDPERESVGKLRAELLRLRAQAMEAQNPAGHDRLRPGEAAGPSSGPWQFHGDNRITVVCARWPDEMLARIPYTDPADPDFIELLSYSELDSLFELFGHLRAVNPDSHIAWRRADRMTNNDYTTHLISLGGVDWNLATTSLLDELRLPVRQIADWSKPDDQFFEVDTEDGPVRHRPILESKGGRDILREDVALFARAVNPGNQERTVTICGGMYGRGTYGVVRALTDRRFRERNEGYLRDRFGSSRSYCLISRVRIMSNETITPDWTIEANRLFEWTDGSAASA